ncbi:MAG TPA: class III extradiol ring-cleavage dioxygenase, partial [Burkholderiaceae bacterium]|nr:class III extradiol ring-cleavage dioxygenase [Burkholderiaceae bacterium]
LAHIQMGQALRALSNENVLVIGSGFSFHNLKAFFSASTPEATHNNQAFEAWLLETCASQTLTEAQRAQRLLAWKEAPGATFCHPREEHLLPLHVCYGLAERACAAAIELDIMGKRSSMYGW